MDRATIRDLQRKCINVRRGIIEEIYVGGGGHVGGSLSVVEILTVLYFHVMRIRPEEPDWPDRDRLVLSKGHAAPALYAVLAERGYFPTQELKTFMQPGTRLQKHVDMQKVRGADVSSGSLGQGLSIAIGMALADRMDKLDRRVYCVVGDGESQEGQIWEAAMAAAQFRLDKLIAVLDHNRLQVDGFLKDIIEIEPVEAKWESFGWHVQRVPGHDIQQLISSLETAHSIKGKPHMIIADTIKGNGINFMENQIKWHSSAIQEEEYQLAMAELDAAEQALDGD
jgi:transketolase